MRTATIGIVIVTALGITSIAAAQNRLPRECRQEIRQLCGTDRSKIRECLRENYQELSSSCQSELRERMQSRRNSNASPATKPAGQSGAFQAIPYGDHERQGVDFYAPALGNSIAGKPPLVMFIHGGGWSFGQRSSVQHKPKHFTQQGYAFASTGYRVLPDAPVEDQAKDVAAAVRTMRQQAGTLGFDPDRIILMGHSAGAHLAALVSTQDNLLGEDLAAVKGVILLDGAGYDVAANMQSAGRLASRLYDRAFGDDVARQSALSPVTHVGGADATDWLILHVDSRPDARAQSELLGSKLNAAGAKATVTAIAGTDHGRMNRELGSSADDATTQAVDAFLEKVVG